MRCDGPLHHRSNQNSFSPPSEMPLSTWPCLTSAPALTSLCSPKVSLQGFCRATPYEFLEEDLSSRIHFQRVSGPRNPLTRMCWKQEQLLLCVTRNFTPLDTFIWPGIILFWESESAVRLVYQLHIGSHSPRLHRSSAINGWPIRFLYHNFLAVTNNHPTASQINTIWEARFHWPVLCYSNIRMVEVVFSIHLIAIDAYHYCGISLDVRNNILRGQKNNILGPLSAFWSTNSD